MTPNTAVLPIPLQVLIAALLGGRFENIKFIVPCLLPCIIDVMQLKQLSPRAPFNLSLKPQQITSYQVETTKQKVHDLEIQLQIMKEENSTLVTENER